MTAHDPRVTLTEEQRDDLDDAWQEAAWSRDLHAAVERIAAEHVAVRLAPIRALAEEWEQQAEPYLPGGRRYDNSSDTIRARADCRSLDAYRLRNALDAPQDAPRGPVGGERGAEVAGGRSEGRGLVEACQWVCDGCTKTLTYSEVADWADGEHVLCETCNRPDGACFR